MRDWAKILRGVTVCILLAWVGITLLLYIAGEIAAPWSR